MLFSRMSKYILPAYSSAKTIKIKRVSPELWSQMYCHFLWITMFIRNIPHTVNWKCTASCNKNYLQKWRKNNSTNTHIHTNNGFMALFLGLPRWAGAGRNLLLDFMVQGKISEADTPTIRLGTTPSGLISDPPHSSPIFMPDALPATTRLCQCAPLCMEDLDPI